MKHLLSNLRVVSGTFGIYSCSCRSLGYATLSPQFSGRAAVERAIRRNHDQHVKRATR